MICKHRYGFMTIVLLVASALGATSGCYRSVVQPPGAVPVEPSFEERQWFTMAGLVRLSDSAGAKCNSRGVAYAETRMGGGDILVNIGLALTGTLLGSLACPEDSNGGAQAACINSFAIFTPFLLSSRTVTYKCAAVRPPARLYGRPPAPGSPLPEDVQYSTANMVDIRPNAAAAGSPTN